jgi:hypothetical protein
VGSLSDELTLEACERLLEEFNNPIGITRKVRLILLRLNNEVLGVRAEVCYDDIDALGAVDFGLGTLQLTEYSDFFNDFWGNLQSVALIELEDELKLLTNIEIRKGIKVPDCASVEAIEFIVGKLKELGK